MFKFNTIIKLSRRMAKSLLKEELPASLKKTKLFDESDKAHILKCLTDESIIKQRLDLANTIDVNADWEPVKNRIGKPNKRGYWGYVAAASVIGILSIVYLSRKISIDGRSESKQAIAYNIQAGTDKAILTLGDGSVVMLEKGSVFQTPNAKSNGEDIVYLPAHKTGKIQKQNPSEITYNYLTVPRGGQFHIVLSDGTEVWMNSESQLKYPVNFPEGKMRVVELVYGEAYFDVSPSTWHKGACFKVLNDKQEVQVLGTEFNIKAYKEETNIYTTLVEGKVEVSFDGKKQNLVPNQQSNFNLNTHSLLVSKIDIYNEISWKEGVFSFENKPLKEIMKVLSRWYDMEVLFGNKNIENVEFIGVLSKSQKINEILDIIKNFGIISSYEIKDKTILLN